MSQLNLDSSDLMPSLCSLKKYVIYFFVCSVVDALCPLHFEEFS